MTKKQAKIFARIHSATMLSYTDGFAFMNIDGERLVPDKDEEKMLEQIEILSRKIIGDLPYINGAKEIYEFVVKNY